MKSKVVGMEITIYPNVDSVLPWETNDINKHKLNFRIKVCNIKSK